MRRRTWLLLALLGLGMAWGGLPRGREMGSMTLIRMLGVDWEDGQYVVTASTGRRARGFQGEEAMEPLILSARRDTLSAALAAVAAGSEQEVYFGYVDQLLLGRELVERGALIEAAGGEKTAERRALRKTVEKARRYAVCS